MRKESKATRNLTNLPAESAGLSRNQAAPSRRQALRAMLLEMRTQELTMLGDLEEGESRSPEPISADDLDNARNQEDIDVQIGLIAHARERLSGVSEALARLENGEFGLCEECGDEIAFERLRAVPMASRCVGCQHKLEVSARMRASRAAGASAYPAMFDSYSAEPRRPEPRDADAPPSSSGQARRRGRPRKAER